MDKFFNPHSIVVVGVSNATGNLGRIIVENLQNFKFRGNLYAVGSSEGVIGKNRIYRNLQDIEDTPDLAVILVPAVYTPSILEECGKKGIRHVIIESGGFSEFSEDRGHLEEEIKRIARSYNIKVIGPNCFGVINLDRGVVLPFFILSPHYMESGGVSIISQSGGVFYDTCMISSCEHIGLCKVVSIGNKLLTNENECLEYLIHDESTEVIGLYLEHFSDGKRFMEIAASTEKPIVLLKANRTQMSREIARFHTSALAGDEEVAHAAMKQAGVILVEGFYDFIDSIKALTLKPLKGKKIGVISRSGGHSVLAADAVEKYGFSLSKYSESFFSRVKEMKLNVIKATNPLDVGDVYDLDLYNEILEAALKEDDVDGVVFVITYSSESDGAKVKRFIKNAESLTKNYNKPIALSVITNKDEWFSLRDSTSLPVFYDCDRALWAFERLYRNSILKEEKRYFHSLKKISLKEDFTYHQQKAEIVHLSETLSFLEKYNLPVCPYKITKEKDEISHIAESIGYPVVLKNASSGVIHKTDIGGVVLNIQDRDRLKAAIERINATEYLVQKMCPPGVEMIVGIKWDKSFGHVIVLGTGGIFTELIRDKTMRILPVSKDIAEKMIDELKGSALLKGFRGMPEADIDALKGIIVGLSDMVLKNPDICELDLNPVIVYEKGSGAVIVDARMSKFFS